MAQTARYLEDGAKTLDKEGKADIDHTQGGRNGDFSFKRFLSMINASLWVDNFLVSDTDPVFCEGARQGRLGRDRVVGKGTTTARLTSRRTSQSATGASGVDNFLMSDPNFLHVFFFTHSYPPSAPPVTTGGRPNIGRTTTGATDSWTWATTREQDLGSNSSDWRSARFLFSRQWSRLGLAVPFSWQLARISSTSSRSPTSGTVAGPR